MRSAIHCGTFTFLFHTLLWLCCLPGVKIQAAQIYSQDPAHLWNRLYDAMLVRTNAGVTYDDLLEPPYWSRTEYLLDGEPNRRALQLLTDFSAHRELAASMTAQQKAIMQRDLLGIFTWVVSRQEATQNSRTLAKSLAGAIHRIALDATSIKKLPDNYAAAVRNGRHATSFDPAVPEQPFLPKDLFDKDGAWLPLAALGNDLLPATLHFEAFKGRSAFSVYFRHPEGRQAGEEYLRRLAQATNRLGTVLDEKTNQERTAPTEQFPPHTIWALVRHAILLDRDSNPVISPIVENVQMRVYRSIKPYAAEFFDRDGRLQRTGEPSQIFLQWELRRKTFLGEGGFQLTQPGEDQWPVLLSPGYDPFENEGWILRPPKPPPALSCSTCHAQPGIHSVNSRTRFFEDVNARPAELKVANLEDLANITEFKSRGLSNWQLLRWIIAEQSAH